MALGVSKMFTFFGFEHLNIWECADRCSITYRQCQKVDTIDNEGVMSAKCSNFHKCSYVRGAST